MKLLLRWCPATVAWCLLILSLFSYSTQTTDLAYTLAFVVLIEVPLALIAVATTKWAIEYPV